MNPPRVYHSLPLRVGHDLALDEAASRHLQRVLRMRAGDALTLFDGNGGEYAATLTALGGGRVRVRIERHDAIERESPLALNLAQVISAGELMDLTVQKAVELGAASIQPLASPRSKVRLDAARAQRRVAHWQRVAIAACEQCGRNRVPAVAPVLELFAWLQSRSRSACELVLDPTAPERLSQVQLAGDDATLLVGAEAGLAEHELELARRAGFARVRLGPRVLRTETAGLAALAAMQALRGDF